MLQKQTNKNTYEINMKLKVQLYIQYEHNF